MMLFKDLSNKVEQIQQLLAKQITADFQNTLKSPSNGTTEVLSLSQLADACSVVSVLEDTKVKADLLKWFIGKKPQRNKIEIEPTTLNPFQRCNYGNMSSYSTRMRTSLGLRKLTNGTHG